MDLSYPCVGLKNTVSSPDYSPLADDGIEFDKKHDIEWHKSFAQVIGRILRIERLAEKILDELHVEAGRGQFEVALGHTACNYAADNLVFTHEVIRAVARKRGLLATFLPKYALDDIGSGFHVHLSLYQNGENVFMATGGTSRYGMSTVGQEFMARFLHHLPAILAFTAPLPNS